MTVYVEFHPDQVQRYLTRWSDLKGRRGASRLLREVALPETVAGLVAPLAGVELNQHVADVDGAISLVLDDHSSVARVQDIILGHLGSQCPAARFHVVTAQTGTAHSQVSYFRAFHDDIEPKIALGATTIALPAPAELPTAKRCRQTGTDLCVGTRTISDGTARLVGADVRNRLGPADWRNSRHGGTTSALILEDELARGVGFDEGQIRGAEVEDFAELAELGPPSKKRNHLATVFIDGNRIGDLINACDDEHLVALSQALNAATIQALTEATRLVCELTDTGPGGTRLKLGVLPHIVGGDDVLVTVPALVAVPFVRRFLTVFASHSLPGVPGQATASAGVVIHHQKFPFTRAADHATDLLAQAKKQVEGETSSILIAEVTREAVDIARSEHVWTLSELDEHDALLDGIAGWPNSARTNLERAAAQWDHAHTSAQTLNTQDAFGDYDEAIWVAAATCMLTLRRSITNHQDNSPDNPGDSDSSGDGTNAGGDVDASVDVGERARRVLLGRFEQANQMTGPQRRTEIEAALLFTMRVLAVTRWWMPANPAAANPTTSALTGSSR